MAIIGHTNILDFLQTAIKTDRLAHAYLFSGPANVGKTTVANFFLNELIAKDYPTSLDLHNPQSNKARYPDFHYLMVEDNGEIKIAQVSALRQELQTTSLLNGVKKIAVIYQADKLNISSANALLKTLEEPKGESIFILLADDLQLVPSTIVSRCVNLRFNLVSRKTISQALAVGPAHDLNLEQISAFSLGRPGLAVRYLQSPELFGKIRGQFEAIGRLLPMNISQRMIELESLSDDDRQNYLDLLIMKCRDLIFAQSNLPELTLGEISNSIDLTLGENARLIQEVLDFKKQATYHLRSDYFLQKLLINL